MEIINLSFKSGYNPTKEEQQWLDDIQKKANEKLDEEIFNIQVFGKSPILEQMLTIKKDDK